MQINLPYKKVFVPIYVQEPTTQLGHSTFQTMTREVHVLWILMFFCLVSVFSVKLHLYLIVSPLT